MSAEKASLVLGDRTLARRAVDALRAVGLTPTLILRPGQNVPPDVADVAVLRDAVTDGGPLAGLQVLLRTLPTPWALVLACDQPLVAPPLLRVLIEQCDSNVDAVAGRPFAELEPFPSLYARSSLPGLESAMAGGGSMRDMLANIAVHEVGAANLRAADPTLDTYVNVNRPEDLRRVASLL